MSEIILKITLYKENSLISFNLILIDEASAQTDYFASRKRKVQFSMAIGHGELMQECLPEHLRMLTVRMK